MPSEGIQPLFNSRQLVYAALIVCDRWDADEVDDDAMSVDIARLRHPAEAAADE